MSSVLGLDIGGANLKAYHLAGLASNRPFALWKAPQRLAEELRILVSESPPFDRVAVTMTGELCDCFDSQRQGVLHILDAVASVVGGAKPIWVWTNQGKFVPLAAARKEPLRAASANWLALATFAGRLARQGPALLIDIGTTTTDIIPLLDGKPVPKGLTDMKRFETSELVYIGWRRTPLCALTGTSRAAEFYATTLDAYLELEVVEDDPKDTDTADGRPATRAAANRRLARMMGGDLETTSKKQRNQLASEIHFKVTGQIAMAVTEVVKKMRRPPVQLIASGSGEFLVPMILRHIVIDASVMGCPILSLRQEWGEGASKAACATSVASLCPA